MATIGGVPGSSFTAVAGKVTRVKVLQGMLAQERPGETEPHLAIALVSHHSAVRVVPHVAVGGIIGTLLL